VHFLVSSDNPSLFSAGPAVASDGTLTYTTATNANGVATITVRAQDDGGTANGGVDTSAPQTFTITVTAVDDAPRFTFPGSQIIGDAMPLVFDTNRLISITDVDAGTSALQLAIGVAHGTLTLGSTNGLVMISGANGSSNLVFTGTLTDLNASLSNLTYTSRLHYSGDETLTLSVNDLGNTGDGGPLGDFETVAITVVPTNHAPVFVSAPVTNAVGIPLRSNQNFNRTPVDLSAWHILQYGPWGQGPADWTLSQSNTTATQQFNADASALMSDVPMFWDRIEGGVLKFDTTDNDFIGFIFGFENSSNYYLFDWKQETEAVGAANGLVGMSVKVITADPQVVGSDALWSTFESNPALAHTLYHNSIPYATSVGYSFMLDFRPGDITIQVSTGTNVLADIHLNDTSYPMGKFGFYNFSQAGVFYTGFNVQRIAADDYTYQAAASDVDGDTLTYSLVNGPTNMTVNATNGLVQWVPDTSFSGTVTVTIQVSDDHGGTALQTFPVYVPPPLINKPPFVSAGPDGAFSGITNAYTLEGSIIDDGVPTNAPLTVSWSKVFGPGNVTFGNSNAPVTTAQFSTAGLYRLQLVGSDSLEFSTNTVDIRADMLCTSVPTNIVMWLPATLDARDAITGTTGITQNVTYPSGKVGLAFSFNGSSNSVRMPAQPSYDVGASPSGFTIEFWGNQNFFPQNGSLLGWANGPRIERFTTSATADSLRFFVTGTNVSNFIDAPKLWPNGTWTHIAVTYDRSSGLASFYINGIFTGSTNVGPNVMPTSGDFFLAQVPGSAGNFAGLLDEVSIYSRPLNAEEIFQIFAAGLSGKCPDDNNLAPEVFAGPDLFLRGVPATTTLQGEVTDDGLPLNWQVHSRWSVLSGPGTVSFADANSPTTSATFSTNGVYVLQLTADDGEAPSSDLVEIRVEDFCAMDNPQGLVAWWPANGIDHDAINGYDAIRFNGANYTNGRVASAFNFDGVNDFVRMPAQTNYDIGASPTGFTVEFWLNAANFQNGSVLGWANGVRAERFNSGAISGDSLRWDLAGTNSGQFLVSQRLWAGGGFVGKWVHLALTYERSTGIATLYVNGLVNATANVGTNLLSTAGDFYLENVPGSATFFTGQFDEVSLYSRPLSRLEVLSLFVSGSMGKCLQDADQHPQVYAGPDITIASTNDAANLSGFVTDDGLPAGSTITTRWQAPSFNPGAVTFGNFNSLATTATFSTNGVYSIQLLADDGEKQGSDFVEVRVGVACPALDIPGLVAWWPGNGNTIDKISGIPAVLMGADYTNGKVAQAFNLHGTNDFVFVSYQSNYDLGLSTNGFSIEFWIKGNFISGSDQGIWSWNNSATNGGSNGINMRQAGSSISCDIRDVNGVDHGAGGGVVFDGNWHHYAVTYDRVAGQLKSYVDGTLRNTVAAGVFQADTRYDLQIGRALGFQAGNLHGQFDEIALYNRPLTLTEVQTIFNAGAAGKCITPSNMPPLVSAGSDKIISLPTNTVTLDGAVFDDALPSNTLALAWTYIAGDSTVFFSSTNTAATSVSFTNTGTYTFQLTASDGQFSASDTVTISVLPDLRARPTVTITAPEDQSLFQVPTAGTTNLTITATAADADGQVTNVEFFVNGSSVGSVASAPYSTTVPDLAPATYVLTAVATDNDGLSTTSAPVTAIIFVDSGEPEVGIFNPADSTIVTAPTNIIGIANSPLLQSWHLRYRLAPPTGGSSEIPTDDAGWATLASGNTSVVSNTLATFDPTMLLNGIYQVQVVATDLLDRSAFSQVTTLVVDRNLKIGQFTISFNDLSVPVPGLPIQIVRTYDSRAAAAGIQGDFGTGWTLDIRNVRLQKNRSLGADWQETSTGGLFPTYALDPIQDRIVSITFPDGNVQKFRLEPNPSVQPLEPIENPKWRFTPLGNTVGTLEPASIDDSDGEFMIVVGDVPGTVDLYDLNYFSTNTLATTEDLNRNPTLFRYTSAEGYRYLIDEVKGLQSVSDPNGNTLEIGTNGLVWTNSVSGTNSLSVAFQRDDGGRITNIVDAAGNSTRYAYSTNGDLVAFTDRTGLTNGFSYTNINFPHYLTGITDARGLSPVQNRYDTSGRLIGNIDGFGNAISYAHDLANHREYVTNRLGQVTASDYDDHGNVIHVIDANGAETFSSYDDNGNVLTTTDALGRTNTFTYDELNDRLTATDPLGNTTRFTYGAQRRVTSVTDARGNTITNTFDAKGNLLTMRDPLGNMTRFAYNDQGLPVAMTNALGQVMQFGYDDQGRLAAEVDANNHETDYARDLNGNLLQQSTTRTTPSGPQTLAVQFFYDAQSRLTNSVFPDGSSAQTLYNAIGKPAVTIDQLGRQTSMQYDELGRVTQTTYADGSKEASAYDAEGRRIASTNRLGQVTQYVYDNVGRLIRSIMPDGTSTTNYFDLAGQLLVSSDAKGNSTFYGYDAAGRSVAVTNALGQVSQSFYDASGNLTNTVDALGRSTRFVYDALNRRVQTIFPDGTTQQTFYDVLGRHFAETDQASNTTWFGYDALGRLTSVTNALGYVTTYTYDELGQQLSQTDANNHTTTFEYDSLGRRVKRTLPGNQVETYAYNIGGLLTNRTDFNGYITSYQYDVMNRLLAKVPDSRRGEPSITYAYNTLGLRTNMIDASGSTAFAYDNRNRLVQKSKFWTGQSAGVSLNYAYDVDGNLTNIVSSETNGVNLAYAYDELNRLAAVNDAALGVTAYTYDDVGNLKGSTYPNFVHSEYQYDSLNRLTNLASDRVGTAIANYAYTVAASGNRTNAVEQLFSSTLNATAKTINRVYTYDSIYRLTGETINGTPSAGSANYNYDAVGNRLSRGITGLSLPPQTFTFDANDRLNTDTYDANGNTLLGSGFGQSLADEYDFENRLVTRHTPSATVHLTYDGDGNRVSKTLTTSTNSVTTYYVVDDLNPSGYAQVLEELVATNSQPTALSCVYTYGHTLISQQRLSTINSQPSTNFYGFDGHNNVRYLTDANGNVTDTYDYDAFGNLIARTGSTLNNYLFTGEQYDADLGLYYLRARYQNTDTGRFWTQDSYEGAGSDPSSLHKYTYCGQNPINAFDPSGNETVAEISLTSGMFGVARAVFGATVGGMTGAITGGYEAIYHGQLSDQEISSAMTEGFKQGALTGGALGFLAGIGSVGQFGVSGIGLLYSGQGFVSSLQSFLTGNYQAASFEGKMAIFGTVTSVAGLTTAFTSEISGGDVIVTPNGYRNAVWGLTDATDRGELIEDAWGKNTPTQFPVWDRFVPGSGLAESIKSIDLDAPSYQSAAGVKSGVSSAITDIVNYKFDEDVVRQGYTIRANAIQQRVLRIAIPRMPSTQQFQGMQQAVEMGRMNNINVIFRVF